MNSKKAIPFLISAFISISLPIRSLAEPVEAKQSEENALVIDEECCSPEGSAYANCTVYEFSNGAYNSKNTSILTADMEALRQIVMASKSKTSPDLKDFGITPESVSENRETMIRSAYSPRYGKKLQKTPKFEELPAELRKYFEYETVSKNAISVLQNSFNSAYTCFRVLIPGKPNIELFSRHDRSGLLPWCVKCQGQTFYTYSREINQKLLPLVSTLAKSQMSNRAPTMLLVHSSGNHRVEYWPQGFFGNYGAFANEAVESWTSIEKAKGIAGWSKVSALLEIEDSISTDYDITLQVKSKGTDCVVDKFIFSLSASRDAEQDKPKTWQDFLKLRESIETAANHYPWIKRWKEAKSGRSLVSISGQHNKASVSRGENDQVYSWIGDNEEDALQFLMVEPDTSFSIISIWSPYAVAIVTDNGAPATKIPKVMRETIGYQSPIRNFNAHNMALNERECLLVDQSGKVLKRTEAPKNYALRSNWPPPSAEDREFDYSWPSDFATQEDLDFLRIPFFPGEQIDSASPIVAQSKTGIIDKKGKVILEANYEHIGGFSDGLALVETKDKSGNKLYGFVNRDGKVVIEPKYTTAGDFHEGLAVVSNNNYKYGFIDTSGKEVIPLQFERAHRFAEGIAPVKTGLTYGYIDKTGNFKIPPQFHRARHFKNGLAYVQIDGRVAYIDKSGKPIGGNYFEHLYRFADDRAVFYANNFYGYIDSKGKIVIPAKYTRAETFRDGVAVVQDGETVKTINLNGKVLKLWGSDGPRLGLVHDGMTNYDDCCKHGFKDKDGKIVIKAIFDSSGYFNEGLCPVKKGSLWGVIDKKGVFVIKPQFEELDRCIKEQRVIFKENGKWGVADTTGVILLPATYDRIYPFANGLAIVQNSTKFGYIGMDGKVVLPLKYDAAHQFDQSGLAHFEVRDEPLRELAPDGVFK